MLHLKTIVTTFAALSVFALSGAAGAADSASGFYLAYSPGAFVQYLAVNDTGRDVSGYLEAIRATPGAAAGITRTQTFGRSNGASLAFGAYTATRTSNGFTLTSMTQEGQVIQQSFTRASVAAINASIAALSSSVNRTRAQFAQSNVKAEIRNYDAVSADDSARLGKAQAAVDAATIDLTAAQAAADRLAAVARQCRADANAAIDKPGVSLAQNQERINAMKIADDAEQSVVNAQRSVNVAQSAVIGAKAEVLRLRSRIADAADRSRALSSHLATNDAVGP
jgi:hypothetical protein